MKTFQLKIIDSQGGVTQKYSNVSDIALYGTDIQILFADGHEDNYQLLTNQRMEMQIE